ncbi:unnamed protein product [Rotaria sp. Silwood1]|nr:unnamed protein product [Rotaria sp. Silwood1]
MPNTNTWYRFGLILMMVITSHTSMAASPTTSSERIGSYKIEGQIFSPSDDKALDDMRVLVNEGEYVGIPRVDGTFVISSVPSGSYVVSVSSPWYVFEPIRVDINANGKIRARKVNFLEPGKVMLVKYPLHFDTYNEPNYFKKREVYRWNDIVFNPMFAPIILGMILFFFLPKLLPQEQEAQQIIPEANDIFQPKYNIPDIADLCARWFGGPRRQGQAIQESMVQEAIKNNISGLISMNIFLSTTAESHVAFIYATDGSRLPLYASVVFEIDLKSDNKNQSFDRPFAFIAEHNSKRDEKEILFAMGTIFRVISVKEYDSTYLIGLQVETQVQECLSKLTAHLRTDNMHSIASELTLGNFLLNMGEFHQVQ